jgi:flagellar biosynthetic protein FliQ
MMTPEVVMNLGQDALMMTMMLAGPLLLAALGVGLLIGIFQAATQIQEMTLSFIPKLGALVVALLIGGPWMIRYTDVGGLSRDAIARANRWFREYGVLALRSYWRPAHGIAFVWGAYLSGTTTGFTGTVGEHPHRAVAPADSNGPCLEC